MRSHPNIPPPCRADATSLFARNSAEFRDSRLDLNRAPNYHGRPDSEESMHLEKLDLLEGRLNRLIELFTRLKEEKGVLERSLTEKSGRVSDLEIEVETLRQERDVIRERLGRLLEMIERLGALEVGELGSVE